MTPWEILHLRRFLAREGKLEPFVHICGTAWVTRPSDGEEPEPILWCPTCQVSISPGIHLLNELKDECGKHALV